MQQRRTLGRREFTAASVLAALSGVAITITGCGGGSSPSSPAAPTDPGAPAPGTGTGTVGTVSSNHGHSAVISAAQLSAAAEVTLDITGASDHPHTVTLTADEVAQIGGGTRVSKESSTDASHSHTVTFN